MAEKITGAAWTAFAKKRELGDDALVKALARLDKSDPAKPEAHAEVLADVVQQLRKTSAGIGKLKPALPAKEAKEVGDKLGAMLQEAEKQHAAAQAGARQAADAAADDEADSPALLTTRLIPLLRELRKGEARFPALICNAGKEAAVMISRRAIAPTRRKLLAEYLDATGAKYITGDCLYERNALTFVVAASAAGLAKKLRAALLAQTGLRLKVRVRGDDGEDEDGEEEAEAAAEALAAATGESAAAQTPPEAPPQPAAAAADAGAAFNARLAALLPQIKAAAAAGHPQAEAIRAKASEAGVVARGRDWAAANRLLDELEALLAAGGAAAAPAAAAPAAAPRGPAPTVVYTQTRLAWGATRKKVQAELQKLERAIVDDYKDLEFPELQQGVRRLDRVLELFDESLDDALDAALNAADPAEKMRHHDEAREIITRYRGFLASDPLVRELDANPFVPIAVQSTLSTSLATLAAKIV